MSKSFFDNPPNDEHPDSLPKLDTGAEPENESIDDVFKTEDGRLAALMAYIPFLCFVPLLNMKENKEAYFHARQGVLLFFIEIIAVIFLIDDLSDFIFKAVLIIAVSLSITGIYFALQGKNYRLPIIGDLADKSKL